MKNGVGRADLKAWEVACGAVILPPRVANIMCGKTDGENGSQEIAMVD